MGHGGLASVPPYEHNEIPNIVCPRVMKPFLGLAHGDLAEVAQEIEHDPPATKRLVFGIDIEKFRNALRTER